MGTEIYPYPVWPKNVANENKIIIDLNNSGDTARRDISKQPYCEKFNFLISVYYPGMYMYTKQIYNITR